MEDFETHPRGTAEVLAQLRAEREALTVQVADLCADASRWRWLKANAHKSGPEFNTTAFEMLICSNSTDEWDAVVDAEIKETP